MTRRISVVTTFNQSGYERYGRRMIETFLANWPENIDLHVYAEDCEIDISAANLHIYDFHDRVPSLVEFKQRWRNDPRATGKLAQGAPDRKGKVRGIGFKWDAVRFSHKIYAVCDLAQSGLADIVIWMDADTICHSPCSRDFIEQQIPDQIGIAYLGRARKYSECGLYALNMSIPGTREFVRRFQWVYDHAEQGIFTMQEWHDSFVFDRVREHTRSEHPTWRELDWSHGLIENEGHPLINSAWGAYLDHLKGKRKDQGRSPTKDLVRPRSEPYWLA